MSNAVTFSGGEKLENICHFTKCCCLLSVLLILFWDGYIVIFIF